MTSCSKTTIPGHPLVIDGRESNGKRAFLLICGLFAVVAPAWGLRFAFADFSFWNIIPWIIIGGAWMVGGAFIGGAVAGEGLHWTFQGGKARLERSSWFGVRIEELVAADVRDVTIDKVVWDSRPDTYRAVVVLKSGERLSTPDRTRASAEALAVEIKCRLGLA